MLVLVPVSGITAQETLFLFVHGIADTYKQAFCYYNLGIYTKPFYSFNFPDATESVTRVDHKKTTFGQEDELTCLRHAYTQIMGLHQDRLAVLYGVSRGASTIFNFLASCKPTSVRAVILESPFAAFDDVMAHLAKKYFFNRIWGGESLIRALASLIFPRYKWEGMRPIDLVKEIPIDLPILLICTASDELVPYTSTERLYDALREAGCINVHLLKLNVGHHAKIFVSPDWILYKQGVHAFYKRYNIAHDAELAQQGEWLLQ